MDSDDTERHTTVYPHTSWCTRTQICQEDTSTRLTPTSREPLRTWTIEYSFRLSETLNFQNATSCEQLYKVSGTYYMTQHGNTPTIPIHRGTLQGGTLSPFLFIIFIESLLTWLSVGSREYKPIHQSQTHIGTNMTYYDHGYAHDISITTRTL